MQIRAGGVKLITGWHTLSRIANPRQREGWSFKPVKITTGESEGGWVAVNFIEEVEADAMFAFNNAYYLMAEMKKGEGGHAH